MVRGNRVVGRGQPFRPFALDTSDFRAVWNSEVFIDIGFVYTD